MNLLHNMEFVLNDHYEYAFSTVPEKRRKPAGELMAILAGVAFSTSGASLGMRAGLSMPFGRAVFVCVAGNLLLGALACFWGMLGYRSGRSSVSLVRQMFGIQTAAVFAVFVTLAASVWIGMSGNMLARLLIAGFSQWRLPAAVTTQLAVCLCVVSTADGWRSMRRMNLWVLPALVILTVYLILQIVEENGGVGFLSFFQPNRSLGVAAAISMIMGNYALSATTMPDICRFAKNRRSVLLGVGIYILVLTVSDVCGILIVQATGAEEISYGMFCFGAAGLNFIWMVLCIYSTQNVNLYVGGLAIQNLVRGTWMEGNISHKTAMLFLGGLSSVLGVMNLFRYLAGMAQFILLCTAPLAGIGGAEVVLRNREKRCGGWTAPAVWVLGIVTGVLVGNMAGPGLWLVPMAQSALLYGILRGKNRKKGIAI
ncbi:MAG: cytosine permease [Lachnospiraceae bacterium]|nr:cytosine permease [Lachnospiraceae bacterium]